MENRCTTVLPQVGGLGLLEPNADSHASASKSTYGGEHAVLDVRPDLIAELETLRVDGNVHRSSLPLLRTVLPLFKSREARAAPPAPPGRSIHKGWPHNA
jgi:hypothetical protein